MLTTSQLLLMARQFERLYGQKIKETAEAYGMSAIELNILLFLHNNPCYDTARDIVEYRFIAKSHVSKAVELLIQKGLLSASEDPDDRRIQRLKIRPDAAAVLAEGCAAQQSLMEALQAGITDQEQKHIEAVLMKLSHNLKNQF